MVSRESRITVRRREPLPAVRMALRRLPARLYGSAATGWDTCCLTTYGG
jgi:hypothetical protein